MTEHADASILRKTRIDHIATEFERVWRLGVERDSIEHALVTNGDVPKDELLRELLLLEIELRQGDGQYVSQADYRFRFSAHSAVLECVFAELKVPSELTDTLVLWSAESITDDGHSAPEDPSGVWRASSHHATLLMDSGARPVVDVRPRVIGDFELIDQIDEGGMGVVYKARQKSLNRIVALKLIKSGIMANADELRRFQREAAAAAKLNHPNILPVYEFGKHGDSTLYIAMPFVQGKTLRDSLDNGTMNPRASADLLLTLAKAMVHAHARQILHRDLKPNNILIDEKQNPLILDFGLACDVSLNEQLTQSGQIMGAPGFMPPEQAGQQNGKTDFRSDIYALGAILYYTLRGVAPFTGASGLDVIQRVLNEDPVSPRADDKSIPRDLETICLKCLRKEKEQRYQSADELASDLALFLEGKPIVARPLPVLEQAIRWCRRRPWQAAIIGLLFFFAFAATATAGVMTKLQKEEHDARLQAEDARQHAEAAALDAQDATVYAFEHQVRAQLSASDPTAISTGVNADTATQPAAAKSVDNTYVENERAYSLPKVLNSAAGDWGYFDSRPSPSGKLLAVCDHSGVVQILDASNGREIHRLAKATTRPEDNWDMHLAFFESEDPRVKNLKRPVFTFSLDWVDETTLVAVDDQKRLLKYSLAAPDEQNPDKANAAEPDVNQPAADQAEKNQPEKDHGIVDSRFTPVILSELSEPGHLVRVRSSDGAMLVCLESGAMNLFGADGGTIATNTETASRPMNCHY